MMLAHKLCEMKINDVVERVEMDIAKEIFKCALRIVVTILILNNCENKFM